MNNQKTEIILPTQEWSLPLLEPRRNKGLSGGRGSGKSHVFGENAVEEMVLDPYLDFVCIREIQKSLKFSAKKLIEQKIRDMGVSSMFDITQTEIRRKRHDGGASVMIFQGMQDHTADSIKSLEGFGRAWIEEAQSISHRSLELLVPTIRQKGSELWFSWNPDDESDPVEEYFREREGDADTLHIHVNYDQNVFLPEELRYEAEKMRERDPETYAHVWLGGYKTISKAQIFAGKYSIKEFEPKDDWSGPYYGIDWGFAEDPTAATKSWIHDDTLYIEYEWGGVGIETDHIYMSEDKLDRAIGEGEVEPSYIPVNMAMPGIEDHVVRGDNARPETISFVKRAGMRLLRAAKKWQGSVEDGIQHIRSYRKVVIHPRCKETANEFKKYSYKVDKQSGDIMPVPVDKFNHFIDSIRYAIEPIIGVALERKRQPSKKPEKELDAWGRVKRGGGDSWTTV